MSKPNKQEKGGKKEDVAALQPQEESKDSKVATMLAAHDQMASHIVDQGKDLPKLFLDSAQNKVYGICDLRDREGEVDGIVHRKQEMRILLADASLRTIEVVDLVLSCADVWLLLEKGEG